MGIGHRQLHLIKTDWQHRFSYGGVLRNQRKGRGQRPLSSREPVHAVFKVQSSRLRGRSLRSSRSFLIVSQVIQRYGAKLAVKIEQISIQNDHVHLLLRSSRRSQFGNFFRTVAGQIAQRLEREGLLLAGSEESNVTDTPSKGREKGTGLWKHRPFSRVVRGWRAYKIAKNYIQLNEQEARGRIPYRKTRLRGLSMSEWQLLWS